MKKDRRMPWEKAPQSGAEKPAREPAGFDDEIIDLDEIVESSRGGPRRPGKPVAAAPPGRPAGIEESGFGFSLKEEPDEEEGLFGQKGARRAPPGPEPEDDLFPASLSGMSAPEMEPGPEAAAVPAPGPEARLAEAEAELEALLELTEVVEPGDVELEAAPVRPAPAVAPEPPPRAAPEPPPREGTEPQSFAPPAQSTFASPGASAAAAQFAAQVEEKILVLVREMVEERLPGLVRDILREEIARMAAEENGAETPRN